MSENYPRRVRARQHSINIADANANANAHTFEWSLRGDEQHQIKTKRTLCKHDIDLFAV